jgi:hypothetical protein
VLRGLGLPVCVLALGAQLNTFAHVVYATFMIEELGAAHPKPVYRCECHPSGANAALSCR